MKKQWCYFILIIFFAACKKSEVTVPPHTEPEPDPGPVMQYIDLHDAIVNFDGLKKIDIDKDGTTDFSFSTLLVGDPLLKLDRRQYYAHSKIECYLLNNEANESPVMNKGDRISRTVPGYQWYEISAIVLAEKIIPETGIPFWQGLWTQAGHKYLPLNIKRNGAYYFGWIELSFDSTAEKLIIHKAAICAEPGLSIKAGF